MKILIATESYYPTISGVAVFSRYLALGLIKNGHEVHVMCPATRFATYDEMDEGIHVHRIRSIKNPFRPMLRVSFMPRSAVEALFVRIKPDAVHMQDPTSICSEVLRMCKKTNTPRVITNHFAFDYVLSYLPWLKPFHPYIAKRLEKYLLGFYNSCDYITFPSKTIENEFTHRKLHIPSVTVSNGVNLDQFFPSYNYAEMKQHLRIPNKHIVLHVGRLDQDKKPAIMIKAFSLVAEQMDVHFIICGDGNKKNQLVQLAKKAGLTDRITFTGFIDHKVLPQLYQMATVFTTASTIETQGIVALEAMASGLPLVVARAGALPELLETGKNGFMFDPNNATDMADKLLLVLKDQKQAKKMGERSLEMVEKHEIELTFNQFEHIYRTLVTEKGTKNAHEETAARAAHYSQS